MPRGVSTNHTTGYNQSEILKRPTTAGHTIMVPSLQSGPNEVPYPTAFKRAKKFLKDLLQRFSAAKHEFVLKMGSWTALNELVRQLKMYARREGPFSSLPSSDTLSWWRALSESSDANVLAVCYSHSVTPKSLTILRQFLAIRIYSASINSMADERTVSNFTWFNSSLRNRQKVGTLTWMIQIRQWVLHLVRIFTFVQGKQY